MSKEKKTTMVRGVTVSQKEAYKKQAEARNITMACLGRMALEQHLEEGCNEPIIMQQFIELTQKVNELERIIPKKKFDSIQKNIKNIMTIKGGK